MDRPARLFGMPVDPYDRRPAGIGTESEAAEVVRRARRLEHRYLTHLRRIPDPSHLVPTGRCAGRLDAVVAGRIGRINDQTVILELRRADRHRYWNTG